jgi:hypothetical protein
MHVCGIKRLHSGGDRDGTRGIAASQRRGGGLEGTVRPLSLGRKQPGGRPR